jgi:uncharacterized protein YjeT (DUF2065 family)
MNWSDLFAALALYLVLEGVMPFLSPQSVKLRLCGLVSMGAGVVLLYLVRS